MEGSLDRWGWVSELGTFQVTPADDICRRLESFIRHSDPSQRAAWQRMVPTLQAEFRRAIFDLPLAERFGVILEYELPREGGRRPDVLVLENGVLLVLEFKESHEISAGSIDQVAGYARDLREYHSGCRGLAVVPILVPTRIRGPRRTIRDVVICPPEHLSELIIEYSRFDPSADLPRAERWLEGVYAPSPGLVDAARLMYKSQPLPAIRRAEAAGLNELHATLHEIARQAAAEGGRHLVLVTGVPGSGKTVAGLRFAHSDELARIADPLQEGRSNAPALFLSGNRPLVEVLQDALKNKVFVEHLRNYVKEYGFKRTEASPPEHVVIFDEAQRAWDAAAVSKHHKEPSTSEPDIILGIAERIQGWSVVVALVGAGQEIYRGEEGGLALWEEALGSPARTAQWHVHAPPHVRDDLRTSSFHTNDALALRVMLRSHSAEAVDQFVGALLGGGSKGLEVARAAATEIKRSGFALLLTRDLEAARAYVQRRYDWSTDKRYGLLASSMAKNLAAHGIDLKAPQAKYMEIGPWYNDPPGSYRSCCSLAVAASEFKAQGLELDLPIICWGDDLRWGGKSFEMPERRRRPGIHDEMMLRTNAYRVLLTRGRDGMCVFVPPDAEDGMDATASALLRAGFDALEGRAVKE